MVCARCIRVVEQELERLGIAIFDLELGRAEIEGPISAELEQNIEESLSQYGFLLIKDSNTQLVERIKHTIIKIIHHENSKPDNLNFSDYLSDYLEERYAHLSKVFSQKEHITINRYVILQKIERAKELISYGIDIVLSYSFGEKASATPIPSIKFTNTLTESVLLHPFSSTNVTVYVMSTGGLAVVIGQFSHST